MTWTYAGDPAASTLAQVRFLIGDTDSNDEQLQDEEINWLLSENNSDVYATAVDAAETLVAKYARLVNRTVGDLAVAAEARAAHYAALATRLRSLRSKNKTPAGVFIGNDQEQRVFSIGMHDRRNDENRTDYDDFPGKVQ